MTKYAVHVFCDECGQPHPGSVHIALDDPNLDGQKVGDIYDGRDLPQEIVNMQNNKYFCPNTERQFVQRDNRQVFLVRLPDDPAP